MSQYDRQIAYISLSKNGLKTGNAGFIKWESDDISHKLEVHIKGLYETDTVKTSIRLRDGRLFDNIAINAGCGNFIYKEKGQEMGIDRIPVYELDNIMISIPGNRVLEAAWINRIHKPTLQKTPVMQEEESVEEKKTIVEVEKKQESVIQTVEEEKTQKTEISTAEHTTKEEIIPTIHYESKWEQLLDTFENLHPFENERIFLKLTPADFYILRETCQHLSHNSFLLHGYYNYHYLILGKKENQDAYVLGVPGIYHEREIMAAQMFGFEGFEPTKKECVEGSFGYYCVTVEV